MYSPTIPVPSQIMTFLSKSSCLKVSFQSLSESLVQFVFAWRTHPRACRRSRSRRRGCRPVGGRPASDKRAHATDQGMRGENGAQIRGRNVARTMGCKDKKGEDKK